MSMRQNLYDLFIDYFGNTIGFAPDEAGAADPAAIAPLRRQILCTRKLQVSYLEPTQS